MGRRPWRCRCGLPYWWPPVLADAVAVRRGGVRPCGWLVCWLAVRAAGVRPPCWRSVRGWCPSVAVVAVFVAAGGLSAVRWSTGPPWSFRGPWRPFLGLASGGPSRPLLAGVLAVSVGSVPPPLAPVAAGVRCWCLRALLRRRWSRWPCRWPSLLVSLVSVSLRRAVARGPCRWPSVLAAVWRCAGRCHCAVPWWAVCRGPSVRAGVRRGRSLAVPSVLAGVLVCGRWLASVYCRVPWPWRPFRAVGGAGVRRWSLRPVWAVFWALPTGWPCGPCQWLAAVAGGACACGGACLVKELWPVAGWRWAVCGAFRGGGVRLPCLWSLLVSRQRRPWAVRLSKDQTPAAAVAALLVVCVTCLRWRRWRRRRWLYPCASRTTRGGRRSVCRRRYILKRRRTG